MKKQLLAVAILGAFAGVANAQSNVTLYGIIDAGIVSERGGRAGSVTKLTSGVQSGSRLGFKGTEDLGNGLKANFVAETGFCADSVATGGYCTGGGFLGRRATVGLSGDFGSVDLGRQFNLYHVNLDSIDPFGTGLAGNSENIISSAGTRTNNAIVYKTPTIAGFSGAVLYGFGESIDSTTSKYNTSTNSTVGLSLNYTNGPLLVGFAYNELKDPTTAGVTTKGSAKNTGIGATYDFGPAKLHAYYNTEKTDGNGTTTVDNADYLVGISAPVGSGSVFASYINKNDRLAANKDAHQAAIGYQYDFSKRTDLYIAYGKTSNKNGGFVTVGNATESGTGDSAFNLGVRHRF